MYILIYFILFLNGFNREPNSNLSLMPPYDARNPFYWSKSSPVMTAGLSSSRDVTGALCAVDANDDTDFLTSEKCIARRFLVGESEDDFEVCPSCFIRIFSPPVKSTAIGKSDSNEACCVLFFRAVPALSQDGGRGDGASGH